MDNLIFCQVVGISCFSIHGLNKMSEKVLIVEPAHEKTNNLHVRKQRRRSAVQ